MKMSVLLSTSDGWFISHRELVNSWYTFTKDNEKCQGFSLKEQLFEVVTPFRMDSAAHKPLLSEKGKESEKKMRNLQSLQLLTSFCKPDEWIEEKTKKIINLAADQSFLKLIPPTQEEWLENNKIARTAAQMLGPKSAVFENAMDSTKQMGSEERLLYCEHLNKTLSNEADDLKVAQIAGESYLIPPKAASYLGDVVNIHSFLKGQVFDVIVLDPPWYNKSVKRKRGYDTMNNNILSSLELSKLFSPKGCLVICWCTHNKQHLDFVTEELFPRWNVQFFASWYWVKVTKKGVPVYPFGSHHKKPYEYILVGIHGKLDLNEDKSCRVVVSVPSSVHSHKPPLKELIEMYLVDKTYSCLEVFARYLVPGWSSYGNEVVKLQHVSYFHKADERRESNMKVTT